ncbi:MAG: hypothetical protein IJZ94_04695 [Clostridia bacterium]|nr:hypothetical protein [Clostridia bacterium]MBQ8165094.1 hypothetical protein [Clostridia bacterium]
MNSDKKQNLSDIDVRISCDRMQVCINVSGNVSAKEAINLIKERLPDFNNKFFLQTDITAIPDGYSINIHGRKSVKEYLAEKQYVSCIDIFSVCKMAKDVFDKYGKSVFLDILFDYNVIFVEENMQLLNFVFVPFLHTDRQHMTFKEFIRVLFIHMAETDPESEENVVKLLNVINEWEDSGYKDKKFQGFALCIESFMDKYYRNSKKDLITKGTNAIKQLIGGIYVEKRDIKDRISYISFLCDKPKSRHSFAYDDVKKVFLRLDKNKSLDNSVFSCLKIGREKEWADLYIADMTVNSRFGTVYFLENNFCIKYETAIDASENDFFRSGKTYAIKDGQTISIGKLRYTVKIYKKAV